MPAMPFLPRAVRDFGGDLPELPLENFIPGETVTEPIGFALISRPGLSETGTSYGSGPIRALYKADGVLSGVNLAVSGSNFYVDGVSKGSVNGSGWASIAGNQMGAVVTRGQDANFYDGVTFRDITFPDSAYVRKVLEQGGRFVFIREGSHRYYWTAPLANMLDGSGDIIIDGLDYASAESEPDRLVDGLVFEDHLILGGLNTIEFHGETGDDKAPWAPTLGRVYNRGVRETGCMTLWDNVFAFVSPEHIVYRYNGSAPMPISDEGTQKKIEASTTCSLDSFFLGTYEFLRVKLDDTDILIHPKTMEPFDWKTSGSAFLGGPTLPGPIFGSTSDGKLLELDGDDELGGTLTRIFRAGLAMDGGNLTIDNLFLRCNPGKAASGSLSIQMRYSRDAGKTWTGWISTSLGSTGQYRTSVEWRSLGMFDQPGALFEFKYEGNAPFRCSGVLFNEALNGRSRG